MVLSTNNWRYFDITKIWIAYLVNYNAGCYFLLRSCCILFCLHILFDNDRDSLRSEKFTIQKLAIEKGIMGDDVTGIAPLSNNRQPNKCNSRLSKEDGI